MNMPHSTTRSSRSPSKKIGSAPSRGSLPSSLFGFIWLMGKLHQALVAGLSLALFLTSAIPLELQRRIVNEATQKTSYSSLLFLVSLYLSVAVAQGAMKLSLNLYRSWLGETATRWLRALVLNRAARPSSESILEGVELSIVLAEAEPVGAFVGTSISEPLLQIGILVTVGGYLIFLQPLMMLAVAVTFAPQIVFVPIMQAAINRRVEAKVAIMRDVSEGMVHVIAGEDGADHQTSRIAAIFSANMGIFRYKFAMNFLMNFMAQLGYVGIFVLGGYYVVTGKTEIGTVVAFVSGLPKIVDPWGAIVDWYRDLRVTQVKFRLIKDAAKFGGASNRNMSAFRDSTLSRAERSRLY
jgi:ABC-type bacteriocin/lantibiotic exporter with double-glycine peptidase domain